MNRFASFPISSPLLAAILAAVTALIPGASPAPHLAAAAPVARPEPSLAARPGGSQPSQPPGPPDLAVRRLDRSATSGDWQSLTVSGNVAAEIVNLGEAAAVGPVGVTAFEDVDGDRRLMPGVDTILGDAAAPDVAPGELRRVFVPLSGPVTFRDNLIHVAVDPSGAISELDEGNNVRDTGQECRSRPAFGSFRPTLEWQWTQTRVLAGSKQVMMTPVVTDLDADGVPDVVFATFSGYDYWTTGHLRALRGDSGTEIFTVAEPAGDVAAAGSIAAGDIDGDGLPEIIAVCEGGGALLAFEGDGTLKWRSADIQGGGQSEGYSTAVGWGGPSLADLDGDGTPEIVVGNAVLNADGTLRWQGPTNRGRGDNGLGPLSVVADIDLDGKPEIVGGSTAYRADGTVMWTANTPDGFPAVANFDADPYPEIPLVADGQVYLLDQDGERIWGPVALPGGAQRGRGGPPTVGDTDGDGRPEIGAAGGRGYMVVDTNGRVLWTRATRDLSSNVTGSAVFDFEGDGVAEVVYGDELRLRVYRGTDGVVLWDVPRPDGTTYDIPVIVDVDADGNAEIVVVSNNYAFPGSTGIHVYGDPRDTWVRTRQIWNQHTYHVDNVNDDGTIPRAETPSWQTHNTYRLNSMPGDAAFAAPDATASRLLLDPAGLPDSATLSARIGSGGAILVPGGLPVTFYAGDPAAGGTRIATVRLPRALAPGEWTDVMAAWPRPPAGTADIHVVADDDGTGHGTVSECDEANNAHAASVHVSLAPSPTPIPTSEPTRTRAPTPTDTATMAPTATTRASATPTATPRPSPVYLPRLWRDPPGPKHADIAIVIDASVSMSGDKLAAAQENTLALVAAMDLSEDRAAIVAYNQAASVLVPLCGDQRAIVAAVRSLTNAPGTRIDLGIAAARAQLPAAAALPGRPGVIVLLTDGQQYDDPAAAVAGATTARASGAWIYAIGLGSDANQNLLVELAGARERYLHAPSPGDMARLYRDITAP